jgi:hypothetical protein
MKQLSKMKKAKKKFQKSNQIGLGLLLGMLSKIIEMANHIQKAEQQCLCRPSK